MLRASAIALGYPFEMAGIGDRSSDTGIPGSGVILDFVDAVFFDNSADAARDALAVELGPEALVDAAGVYANFAMMNRVAEGTGIPIPGAAIERETEMVSALRLDRMLKH